MSRRLVFGYKKNDIKTWISYRVSYPSLELTKLEMFFDFQIWYFHEIEVCCSCLVNRFFEKKNFLISVLQDIL